VKRVTAIERANDAAALSRLRGVRYGLGKGGFDPARHAPWSQALECDCTGFLSWALAVPRQNQAIAGGWVESTAIVADAMGPGKLFQLVTDPRKVRAGDALAIGDRDVDGVHHEGHVALIVEAAADGTPVKMADCSSTGGRAGSAVQVRPAALFPRGYVVVRFAGFAD
jgi:hypothetical protein